MYDELSVEESHKPNDKHIHFAQSLLKAQYSYMYMYVDGMRCTLYQHKMKLDSLQTIVQILLVLGDHWVTMSNIECATGELKLYDSMYCTIHDETRDLVGKILMVGSPQSQSFGHRSKKGSQIVVYFLLPLQHLYYARVLHVHVCLLTSHLCGHI